MKLSIVALAGAVSAAGFNGTTVTVPHTITTTTVVDEYVTYCPEPTTITEGNKTITVTKPGTITITDCPCTRTTTKTTVTICTEPVETKSKSKPAETKSGESKPVETKSHTVLPIDTASPIKTTSSPYATPVHPTHNITISSTSPPISQGGAAAIGVSGAFAGVVAAIAYFI
ncbi:hypothetical protein D0Z03_002651 [Geotrichum reessii]|nr:hypothetical protein D0Z03_002651 [Galactomyces reessii]